jgi:hypothetical protein
MASNRAHQSCQCSHVIKFRPSELDKNVAVDCLKILVTRVEIRLCSQGSGNGKTVDLNQSINQSICLIKTNLQFLKEKLSYMEY